MPSTPLRNVKSSTLATIFVMSDIPKLQLSNEPAHKPFLCRLADGSVRHGKAALEGRLFFDARLISAPAERAGSARESEFPKAKAR